MFDGRIRKRVERLDDKILELQDSLGSIKVKVDKFESNLSSLRGLVNRKIGGFNKGISDDNEESQDLNKSIFLGEDGEPVQNWK